MLIDRTIPRNRKLVSKQASSDMMIGFMKLEVLYDAQEVARQELETATGKPICVSGCGKCCEGMTPVVSRLEAMYALANMSLLPSYQNLKTRAERWMTDGTSELVTGNQNGRFIEGDKTDPLAMQYESLKSAPCPFLSDDKYCTVYDSRPLSCRTYGVTSLAQEICPRPLHYTESGTNRMYIGKDTMLGALIKRRTEDVIHWIKNVNPVMSQVGFFPALIAQELTGKNKLALMPIAPAKQALRQARVRA